MSALHAVALALALGNAPEEAVEGPRQIGLMPLQIDGADDDTRQALEDSLRQGLLRGKVEINLFNQKGVCKTKACRKVLEGKDVIVVSADVKVSGDDYSISVGLSKMGETGELARFNNECPSCEASTVGELIAELASEFIASADAAVVADDTAEDETEPEPEFESEPEPIEEGPADEPAPPMPVDEPAPKNAKALTGIGAALLGLGVGAIGGGAVLIALDGRNHKPSCPADEVDPNGACPNIWTTRGAGIGTLAGGVALAGAGVALLVVGLKRKSESEQAQLRVGPGTLQLTTRF